MAAASFPSISDPGTRLLRQFRQALQTGELQPGDRVASIRALAKTHGVSVGVARSAVDQLKADGLLQARTRSGLYVAKPPAAKPKATHVAVLGNVDDHVYGPLYEHLIPHIENMGMHAYKAGGDRQARQNPQWKDAQIAEWRQQPPYAIVLLGGSILHTGIIQQIDEHLAHRTRLIAVMWRESIAWHSVDVDQYKLAAQAAEHLVQQGHQRIGFLTCRRATDPDRPLRWRQKRYSRGTSMTIALHQALRQANPHIRLSIHYASRGIAGPRTQACPFNPQYVEELTQWLARDNRPTALIGDDIRVATALYAAAQMGLEPGVDLYGLGMGNTPWSAGMGIDSFSLSEHLLAQRVADLLNMDQNQLRESCYHITVPPHLLIRPGPLTLMGRP